MTEPTPPPAPSGQISPDGQYMWNGTAWVPNPALGQQPNVPPQQANVLPQQPQFNYAQPKKKHTVRNVLLTITALFILAVGGCVAVIGSAAKSVSNDIKKDANKPGGTDNPLTITPGKPFTVDKFNYSAGWKVGKDSLGDIDITGLKVTNNRSDKDSALVEIKFFKGTEVLGLSDCTTEPIGVGTTVTLSCTSTDKLPASYDKITINDTF